MSAEQQLSIEPPAAQEPEAVVTAAAVAPAPTGTITPAVPVGKSALYRRVSRRGAAPAGPPPLLEGQTVVLPKAAEAHAPDRDERSEMIRRLTALKGVGQKTAEAAVAAFGPGVLDVVRNDPERVRDELGTRRAQPLIDAAAEPKATGRSPRKAGAKKAASKRGPPRKRAAKK